MTSAKNRPNTLDMEIAVSNLLNYRKHTIIPNISWGLGLGHECDLLVLDDSNRFTEVEIKISKSDLKKDFQKSHGHRNALITRLIYAVPKHLLQDCRDELEKHGVNAGIIVVNSVEVSGMCGFKAFWDKQVKHKKGVIVPDKTIRKYFELGTMRIWSLKQHRRKLKNWI